MTNALTRCAADTTIAAIGDHGDHFPRSFFASSKSGNASTCTAINIPLGLPQSSLRLPIRKPIRIRPSPLRQTYVAPQPAKNLEGTLSSPLPPQPETKTDGISPSTLRQECVYKSQPEKKPHDVLSPSQWQSTAPLAISSSSPGGCHSSLSPGGAEVASILESTVTSSDTDAKSHEITAEMFQVLDLNSSRQKADAWGDRYPQERSSLLPMCHVLTPRAINQGCGTDSPIHSRPSSRWSSPISKRLLC